MRVSKKPWGNEKHFVMNEKCTVKILVVNPNEMISLQKHHKRKEVWFFLTPGIVIIGNRRKRVKKGDVVNIGRRVKHRLIGRRIGRTEVLEIAYGTFSDKDIVRVEDKYGRKGK